MILKSIHSIKKTDNGCILLGTEANALIVFMKNNVIRIRVSFDKSFQEASFSLVTTAWNDSYDDLFGEERKRISALNIPYSESSEEYLFPLDSICLHAHKDPFYLYFTDRSQNIIYKDVPGRAYEKDSLGRLTHFSCIDEKNDHFYGFGETTGGLDKFGNRIRMNPKDACGHDPESGDPLYKHIPFYIRVNMESKAAVGLYYNNSYDTVFDLGKEKSGYWPRYSYYQTDGGDIDLFFIYGPDVPSVLEEYTWLTGKSAMPPKKSLGFSLTSMYYCELEKDCDKEIEKVVDEFSRLDLPIDNFWLGSGYSSGETDNLRYVFNWNRRRFPDPEAFFHRMSERGIGVLPNMKPGILFNHPDRSLFEMNEVFIKDSAGKEDYVGKWWGGEGRFFDFTNPKSREIWKQLTIDRLLNKGACGIWNDNNEYDGVEDRSATCYNEGMKGTMLSLKIIHSNQMARLAREIIEEARPNERPYVVNRAGYAGIQRYAAVWGGDNLTDWRTIKYNIAMILGMGLSGVPNTGCDIGGFAGSAPSSEMLVRWIQSGIFQPRFCMNSANNDNTVTQPWIYPEALPYIRAAMWKRYKMLPYLYSLMYEAHTAAAPIMRPLFFEFPNDENCYTDNCFTFMFGPAVLAAPVVEPASDQRTLYLPAGCDWYDMNDNYRKYCGGQYITIPVDLDSIPMFLRGNSVFFESSDIRNLSFDTVKTVDFFISADSDCNAVYYDDDGKTNNFENGDFLKTDISVNKGPVVTVQFTHQGNIEYLPESATITYLSKIKGAKYVSLNGQKLTRHLLSSALKESKEGWFYNLSDRTVQIKFTMPRDSVSTLLISTEDFDLIGMDGDQ